MNLSKNETINIIMSRLQHYKDNGFLTLYDLKEIRDQMDEFRNEEISRSFDEYRRILDQEKGKKK